MRKGFFPVFIPDHYGSRDDHKYRIDLWDKDGDVYQPVYYGDNLASVNQTALSFQTLVRKDLLVRANGEPFDSVVVVNNTSNAVIEEYC